MDFEYLQLVSHHKYLLATSHASLIASLYGMKYNENYLWIIPLCVYLNSINYWRNPVRGLRRNIDIGFGISGLMTNNIFAMYSSNAVSYYIATFISVSMYPISWYFYRRRQYVISTFMHSLLHFFGNIGNLFLYAGTFHYLIENKLK